MYLMSLRCLFWAHEFFKQTTIEKKNNDPINLIKTSLTHNDKNYSDL